MFGCHVTVGDVAPAFSIERKVRGRGVCSPGISDVPHRLCHGVIVSSHGCASMSLSFVGVVCGQGEMMWPWLPSSVWWCCVSWVGKGRGDLP
jgi:hypothetical protein